MTTVQNELFHYTSFASHGRYKLNKWTSLSMCGFIAQLVEQCIGIAEVMSLNPVEAQNFLGFFPIDHFTVVSLVTWPLNGSEAGVDLVLIQTSLLLLYKSSCSYAN